MNEPLPIIYSDAVPQDRVFIVPPVDAVVFYPNTQPGPTIEQEIEAIVNAYLAAARAGRTGVIKCNF